MRSPALMVTGSEYWSILATSSSLRSSLNLVAFGTGAASDVVLTTISFGLPPLFALSQIAAVEKGAT